MKVAFSILVAVFAVVTVLALTACAGLNVQWAATASYNTPAVTTATMNPGAPTPAASAAKP